MNRRRLLKHLAALSVVAAAGGCRFFRDDHKGQHRPPAQINSLKVILQGPFAVILLKNQNYRINAFVPYSDDYLHEFRYQSPFQQPLVQGGRNSYRFTLGDDGLSISEEKPYVDHGFDDFNPTIPTFYLPDKPFVSLDLPAPYRISYIPPSEPVLFNDGTFGKLPLNHVLEYNVKDLSKVKMQSNDLQSDPGPMTCNDLHTHYRKHWEAHPKDYVDEQRPHIDDELTRCSQSKVATYFFGVGLDPEKADTPEAIDHARRFFNEKLLPIFYKDPIHNPKRLLEIKPLPCGQQKSAAAPMFMPAVYRPDLTMPRLHLISSTQDCSAPAATATSTGPPTPPTPTPPQ